MSIDTTKFKKAAGIGSATFAAFALFLGLAAVPASAETIRVDVPAYERTSQEHLGQALHNNSPLNQAKLEENLAQIQKDTEEIKRKAAEETARKEAERIAAEEVARKAAEASGSYSQSGSSSTSYSQGGSGQLTRSGGVNYYGGRRETWYSQRVLPGGGLDIPGRHVASDGTIRDVDGYIVVAASDIAKGTVVDTSLGAGKVYDSGCASGTTDIYTDW